MVNSAYFRLFGAIIGGFWGMAAAMNYQPFPYCTEFVQVDSSLMSVHKNGSLDPIPAPYNRYERYKYFPGTCYEKQVIQSFSYQPEEAISADFTRRATSGVFDFYWRMLPKDSTVLSGTVFYSTVGDMDSIFYRLILKPQSNPLDTSVSKLIYIKTQDYQLILNYFRNGDSPWELLAGDSIVSIPGGKVIFSLGDAYQVVTRCRDEGMTYECTESGGEDFHEPQKSIWFLTQGRKDSLQTWENGELISTEKYFWSARSAGIQAPRVRPHAAAEPWVWRDFDIMGRSKVGRTTPNRVRSDR